MRGKRFALFLVMIALGAGLGLLYGWIINPVKYEDTTPAMLRNDYKADYVLMVAEIYSSDQNLEQAARRLATLDSLPPARLAVEAGLTARQLGYAPHDLELIDRLALALQKGSGSGTATAPAAASATALATVSASATANATASAATTPAPGGQP